MIIAIDFDGTCVGHLYPEVGPDAPGAVSTLRQFIEDGHRLILYTMRSGQHLQDAVDWGLSRGIDWWAVNTNPDQHTWSTSPKVYANLYIDDAALGCPLRDHPSAHVTRPCVDWSAIYEWVCKLDRKPHH